MLTCARVRARTGAIFASTSWSAGEVSDEHRLKNTPATRFSVSPAHSIAVTVFSNVGSASCVAMTSTSARHSSMAASKAGAKWSVSMASKGGMPNGVDQSCRRGLDIGFSGLRDGRR